MKKLLTLTVLVGLTMTALVGCSATPTASAPKASQVEQAAPVLNPAKTDASQIVKDLMSRGLCNVMPADMTGYDKSFQTCYFYNKPGQAATCRWNVYIYQDNFTANPGLNDQAAGVANSQPPYPLAFGTKVWAVTFDGFSDAATRDSANAAFSAALGMPAIALNPVTAGTTCGWQPTGSDSDTGVAPATDGNTGED